MANLDDINTADVGLIAFWSAEDHKTAGVVDPSDCTGVFTNYSVYDNGLDGYKTLGSGRHFNCRVKNDGWCMAWIDRSNSFGFPSLDTSAFGETGHKGYYDALWNWFTTGANISSTLTTLSYIISLFEAALETSGDFTFSATDVGHYCYEFNNANVLTMLDLRAVATTKTADMQYTTGTILYYTAVASYTLGVNSEGKFANNRISKAHLKAGAADILAENWIPNALTDYTSYAYGQSESCPTHNSILIIWS